MFEALGNFPIGRFDMTQNGLNILAAQCVL